MSNSFSDKEIAAQLRERARQYNKAADLIDGGRPVFDDVENLKPEPALHPFLRIGITVETVRSFIASKGVKIMPVPEVARQFGVIARSVRRFVEDHGNPILDLNCSDLENYPDGRVEIIQSVASPSPINPIKKSVIRDIVASRGPNRYPVDVIAGILNTTPKDVIEAVKKPDQGFNQTCDLVHQVIGDMSSENYGDIVIINPV